MSARPSQKQPDADSREDGLKIRLGQEAEQLEIALRHVVEHYRLEILYSEDALSVAQKEADLLGLPPEGLIALRVFTGTREAIFLTAPGFYFSIAARTKLVRLVKSVSAELGRVVLVNRTSLRHRLRAVAGFTIRMLPKKPDRDGTRGERRSHRGSIRKRRTRHW
jgi:hypothetical protein